MANLGVVFELEAFMVNSPIVAEKLVQAFVLPTDKKMAEKMELDEVATQFYHAFSQVDKFKHLCSNLFPLLLRF